MQIRNFPEYPEFRERLDTIREIVALEEEKYADTIVLGGTNILGGRGSYLGTVVGVILIVLLQSMLSVMQMPEAGRQIIYGVVIVAMLLVYGRGARVES
jgi:predicted ABC-type sugar transport system permease subunit